MNSYITFWSKPSFLYSTHENAIVWNCCNEKFRIIERCKNSKNESIYPASRDNIICYKTKYKECSRVL